jgi:hypothetical protein
MNKLVPEALVSCINCRIDWLWHIWMDRHPSAQKNGRDATPDNTEQASAIVVVYA